ncbi:MAG TPA: VWA domain-containing protein [Desulfobulbaceae bacterium]|nr:VWA domain-containing protein [Desulfobulbaceae bacterium]
MARRRQLSLFNLAFLDIMFCGFGAVVLLVLLVNAQSVRSRNRLHEDLRAEVQRLTREVTAGTEYLDSLKAGLQQGAMQMTSITKEMQEIRLEKNRLVREIAGITGKGQAAQQEVNKLAAALKHGEAKEKKLAAEPVPRGNKARRFEGEGHRQYLTGLKLGGSRVLILVDGSASMLDTSVVNVIRLRNMDRVVRQKSRKWRQVRKTVRWLAANLPPSSTVQLMVFNADVHPFSQKWLPVGDQAVSVMLAEFAKILPAGGTSLEKGFAAAATLSPRPDNIILLTDGLPTQGKKKPLNRLVSGKKRIQFFQRATKKLPAGVPVNTILFPMEGDPRAAMLYWQLALNTRGSFFTPTTDWP